MNTLAAKILDPARPLADIIHDLRATGNNLAIAGPRNEAGELMTIVLALGPVAGPVHLAAQRITAEQAQPSDLQEAYATIARLATALQSYGSDPLARAALEREGILVEKPAPVYATLTEAGLAYVHDLIASGDEDGKLQALAGSTDRALLERLSAPEHGPTVTAVARFRLARLDNTP